MRTNATQSETVGAGGFEEFFVEAWPLAFRLASFFTQDAVVGEEIAQEVFVEVWRLAPRYTPARGTVRSWVGTITHRRAVDRVRSEQSSRDREQRDATRSAPPPLPEEGLEMRLDQRRVRNALAALTALQRQAVELAYYGGHTYREVAVLLDVAEGTVKTRIRDGLIRLRDELGDAS